jgi:transposase InsO family protein
MFLLLMMALAIAWLIRQSRLTRIGKRSSTPQARTYGRRPSLAATRVPMHAGNASHPLAKPIEVREGLLRIAMASPDASCRMIAERFNRDHAEQGWSVGKTYVSEFLRDFRQWRASPRRHPHTIDTAGAVNRVWAIDLTEHRIEPGTRQPLLGILDHASRRMLTLHALRERTAITILRLLLDAIEHHGKPMAIRTDNEAMFTSWVFAFALQWLGIRHQRTLPHSPWMNGRVERVWSTFKQVLRICQIPNELELQATLNLLRDAYNQERPHQSLSGRTPDKAWQTLIERKRKSKRRDHLRRR